MFWDNYEKLCVSIGKSASTVGSEIGISAPSVSGWKYGSVPRSSTLRRIAEYFGISVMELMSDDIDTVINEKIKKTTTVSRSDLDDKARSILAGLRPDEINLVRAYVAGLIANRKD